MADLVKTFTNSVVVLGPPSLWGLMVWGVDRWGDSDKTPLNIGKVIANTQTIDQALATAGQFIRTFSAGSIAADFTATPRLRSGAWDYVIDLNPQSYTVGTSTDATFTCLPVAGTSWSEA